MHSQPPELKRKSLSSQGFPSRQESRLRPLAGVRGSSQPPSLTEGASSPAAPGPSLAWKQGARADAAKSAVSSYV